MKLRQTVDKEVDQNEIESKYLWNFRKNQTTQRVNLFKRAIDFSKAHSLNPIFLSYYVPITDNKFFGIQIEETGNGFRRLFISDENFNIKIIGKSQAQPFIRHKLVACFYDDFIFTFESDFSFNLKRVIGRNAKSYSVLQDNWGHLTYPPFDFAKSCIGFNQKIVIASEMPGIWVYDINLHSYSLIYPTNVFNKVANQAFLKNSNKLYLIILSGVNKILSCDDPLSEWNFICEVGDRLFDPMFCPHVSYKGSVYFLN